VFFRNKSLLVGLIKLDVWSLIELTEAYMDSKQPEIVAPKKHSMLGVASFIFALFFCFSTVLVFSIPQIYNSDFLAPGIQTRVNQVIGLCLFSLILLALFLGIIALFQKNTKKIFAILGIVFSSLELCLVTFIILAGLYIGAQ
jgi:hypothetical protein